MDPGITAIIAIFVPIFCVGIGVGASLFLALLRRQDALAQKLDSLLASHGERITALETRAAITAPPPIPAEQPAAEQPAADPAIGGAPLAGAGT